MNPSDSPETIRRALRCTTQLPPEAANWSNVQQAYRQLLEERLSDLQPLPYYGEGRGIVTCGGGTRYFPSLWVLLRTLRRMGCQLPIEVWYLGDGECDPYMRRLIRELGGQPVDAQQLSRAIPRRRLAGWELKLFAIGCSSFREVLFLDADCLPFSDPSLLFYWPAYLETGLIVWADFPTWNQPSKAWEIVCGSVPENYAHPVPSYDVERWTNKPIPPHYLPNLETGQLIIDKQRAWKAWLVADFFCQHSEFYFQHIHGDCGAWLNALYLTNQPYRLAPWFPDWVVPHTIIQFDFEHRPCFAHRTMDKWSLSAPPLAPQKPLPLQQLGEQALEELRQRWAGQLWVNHRPTIAERLIAGELEHKWALLRRVGTSQHFVQFGPQGVLRHGEESFGTHWEIFTDAGAPLLVLRTLQQCTARLTCQSRKDSWVGRDQEGRIVDLTIVPTSAKPFTQS